MGLTRRMTIKFSLLILALAALPLTPSKALDMKIYLNRTYPGYSSPTPMKQNLPYQKKLKFFTTTLYIMIYTICKTVKTEMPPLVGYREDFKSERMRVIT